MGKFNKYINNHYLLSPHIVFINVGWKTSVRECFLMVSSHRSLPLTSLWNSRLVVCLVISMTEMLSVLQGLKHKHRRVTLRERFACCNLHCRVAISGLNSFGHPGLVENDWCSSHLLSLQVMHCTAQCMWLMHLLLHSAMWRSVLILRLCQFKVICCFFVSRPHLLSPQHRRMTCKT